MTRQLSHISFICAVTAILQLLAGCSPKKQNYTIGVSQCSADIWREKQNAELRMEAYLQENVELRFAAAYDSDERQVQQIDSLVSTGIDLLIVAPNQVQTISPAIDRAFDRGIPVIVFERKTNSQKYSAFIAADNYEMGRTMGEYIANKLNGHGRVLEVKGLAGSSPSIERHKGFTDAISQYPGITLIAHLQGDWTEQSAVRAVSNWLSTPAGRQAAAQGIDYVYGQNDRMALGARRALSEASSVKSDQFPKFCGIDGLPGEDGGISLVRDSVLDASFIYPTRGDRVLQLALDILKGNKYERESLLMSALVTSDNANVLLMQSEEMMRQSAWLDRLHKKADNYLQQLDTQHTITLLAIGIIVLLIAAIVLFYRYYVGQLTLHRVRQVNSIWSLRSEDLPEMESAPVINEEEQLAEESVMPPMQFTEQATVEEAPEEPQSEAQNESVANSYFITRFKDIVEKRLTDSNLSVEDLASDMHLSRVQLYRKVKSITGSTPVELLRTARLNKGYQLLLTTDKSVSEVAYAVGFTAPSYFTKCFKEEYGQLPGDIRQH